MALYRRGRIWWYEFVFNGERIRESTKQGNKRIAEQIEAAKRTQLAKGEVGIEERKKVPTLAEFAARFERFIDTKCESKPRTGDFYKSKLRRLLADNLSNKRLDAIEEEQIQDYIETRRATTTRRKKLLSPASVNRELATLKHPAPSLQVEDHQESSSDRASARRERP